MADSKCPKCQIGALQDDGNCSNCEYTVFEEDDVIDALVVLVLRGGDNETGELPTKAALNCDREADCDDSL